MFKSYQTSFDSTQKFYSFAHLPLETTRVSSTKSIQPLLLSRATQLTSSYATYLPKQINYSRSYTVRNYAKRLNIKRLPDTLILYILGLLDIQELVALILATETDSRFGKTVRKAFEDKLMK